MKKLFARLLSAVMLLALASPVFAADDEATAAADALYALGLFKGTGTNEDGTPIYDLDREPTRNEAIVMFVRLLGKEEEAKAGTWELPFTDVADWAVPYVGYAYANGLTKGTGDATFGGTDLVSASQYLTFVLRALGYDSAKDFQWDKAWELSDTIGLTDGRFNEESGVFLRGDVAIISLNAHEIQETRKTAPYYGLPADIKFAAKPETISDVDNNILYSFLFGNYSLNYKYNYLPIIGEGKNGANTIQKRVKALGQSYPELAGVFTNTFVGCGYGEDHLFIDFPQASLTIETIYEHQIQALAAAQKIKAALHEQGKVTDSMTQKEIAQVYYDYLGELGVKAGGSEEAAKQGKSVEYDSVYACLVNKKADCVARAGAFNLLMHLEDISAQGIHGQMKGQSTFHVLSRAVLDGEEYFVDWGNKKGIENDISSWFEFDEDSLLAARSIG